MDTPSKNIHPVFFLLNVSLVSTHLHNLCELSPVKFCTFLVLQFPTSSDSINIGNNTLYLLAKPKKIKFFGCVPIYLDPNHVFF
jgi:hypothetical protein